MPSPWEESVRGKILSRNAIIQQSAQQGPTASLSFDVLGGLGFSVRFAPLFERLRKLLAPEDARLALPGGAFRISDAVGVVLRTSSKRLSRKLRRPFF